MTLICSSRGPSFTPVCGLFNETLDLKTNGFRDWEEIVIKIGVDYIFQYMTECIMKWRQNGFRNSKGTFVTNADLFSRINMIIAHMKIQAAVVSFWQDPSLENVEAEARTDGALRRFSQSNSQHSIGIRRDANFNISLGCVAPPRQFSSCASKIPTTCLSFGASVPSDGSNNRRALKVSLPPFLTKNKKLGTRTLVKGDMKLHMK